MSIKLMSQVYEYQFTHAEQAIVMCMADHAHDDGTQCFPSIDRMVWKTGYEERQIKRILKQLIAKEVLQVVAFKGGGRGHPTEYAIHLEKAEKKPDFAPSKKGDISRTSPQRVTKPPPQTVTLPSSKGDIQIIKGDIPDAKGDIFTITNANDASSEQVSQPPNRPLTITEPSVNQETERARATPSSSPSSSHLATEPGREDDQLVQQIAAAAGLPATTPRLAHCIGYHRQRLVHADLITEAAKAAEWIASPDNAKGKAMSLRFLDNWLRKVDTTPPGKQWKKQNNISREDDNNDAHWPNCSCSACLSTHEIDCWCMACRTTKHPRGHDPACWCEAEYQAEDDHIIQTQNRFKRYSTIH